MATVYDNLIRLVMTGDVDPGDDLKEWAREMAKELTEPHGVSLEVWAHATASICVGFLYGIAYGREFGVPDCAKELITLVDSR